MEAEKTNIIGTVNMLHDAIYTGVKRDVYLLIYMVAYLINALVFLVAMIEYVIIANSCVEEMAFFLGILVVALYIIFRCHSLEEHQIKLWREAVLNSDGERRKAPICSYG